MTKDLERNVARERSRMKAKAKKLAELANEGDEPDATGKARVEHYVAHEKDELARKKKVLTALAERDTEAD